MIDIQNYVYSLDNYLKETEDDYVLLCPHCSSLYGSEDTSGHLHVSKDKRTVHCFRCDYAASWIQFVMQTEKINYYDAIGILHSKPNPSNVNSIKFKQEESIEKRSIDYKSQISLPSGFTLLSHGKSTKYLSKLRRYMVKRGFNASRCDKYSIGYVSSLLYRIVIPIEGTFYQARTILEDTKPKYWNSKDSEADIVLFNASALNTFPSVIICEGFFSAVACGDAGIALVGKNPTELKMRRLLISPVKRFIITVEYKAERSMHKLADYLISHGKEVELWHYEEFTDPASIARPFAVSTYGLQTKVRYLLYEQ